MCKWRSANFGEVNSIKTVVILNTANLQKNNCMKGVRGNPMKMLSS